MPAAVRRSTARVGPTSGIAALGVAVLTGILLVPTGAVGIASSSSTSRASAVPNPFDTGMNASLVLGQPRFGVSTNGSGPANVTVPTGATFDAAGDLWVADFYDSRVLEYRPPFRSGMSASIAIGQPNLTSQVPAATQAGLVEPEAVAFSPSGDLWVVDYGGSRVLEYVPPFATGMNASVVIGQPRFTSEGIATSATGLEGPEGLAFSSSGTLFVADTYNNRVLEYAPPFSTGMPATTVLGQTGFASSGAGTSSTALREPDALAVAPDGELFVSDDLNNRTVAYDPPFSTGMAATLVLGQPGFTTSASGSGATGLAYPTGVAVDARGDVWVTDYLNNRTVEYRPPLVDGEAISVALGQSTVVGRSGGNGAAQERYPEGLALDARGDVWVVDSWNNRTVEYSPPSYTLRFVESGLPAGTRWTVTAAGSSGAGTSPETNFTVLNGTYEFRAGAGSNYLASPGTGSIAVNGSSVTVLVSFAPAIAGLPPAVFAVAVAEGLSGVAIAAAFVVLWRRWHPPRGSPPSSSAPGDSGGPPPSAPT